MDGDAAVARTWRDRMVREQLLPRDIDDPAVVDAMRRVPRHRYVPDESIATAYADHPVPIGHGATISQPYIVALMAQALRLRPTDRALEVGTGSGYGAAVLAELVAHVTTIERVGALAEAATSLLRTYGDRVEVVVGDGHEGHPAGAPYDAISVTAAAPAIPPALLEQLADGGRLVMPVGDGVEELRRVTRTPDGDVTETIARVRFVPLRTGTERSPGAPSRPAG